MLNIARIRWNSHLKGWDQLYEEIPTLSQHHVCKHISSLKHLTFFLMKKAQIVKGGRGWGCEVNQFSKYDMSPNTQCYYSGLLRNTKCRKESNLATPHLSLCGSVVYFPISISFKVSIMLLSTLLSVGYTLSSHLERGLWSLWTSRTTWTFQRRQLQSSASLVTDEKKPLYSDGPLYLCKQLQP